MSRIIGTISLGVYISNETYKIFNSEEIKKQPFSFDLTNNPTRLYTVKLDEPISLGQIKEIVITLTTGEKYPVIIFRTINRQLFAMKSKCIYDEETDIKNGILVRDKIICPTHGCEYNILTGEADGPPAYNSIPIFRVEEDEKNMTIGVYLPDHPPAEIIPYFMQRNYEDFRKISIIGTGAAGLGAAETLRRIGFTGEINMFTKEHSLPFQKHNLTKYLDFTDKNKLLFYRDPTFYDENSINIVYSGEVRNVENSLSGLSYLQLKDDTKFLYDGLIVASGANEFSDPFSSDKVSRNCVILNNVYNLKKSQRLLKDAKNVLLYNLTPEGLEFASTLKTHRPNLNITYLSPTNYSILDREFTPAVAKQLVEVLQEKGIQFALNQQKVIQIRSRNDKDLVTGYYLGTDKATSPKVFSDIFYLFPSYDSPQIDFLSRLKLRNKIRFARSEHIDINYEQRTQIDNIFAAGAVTSWRVDFDGPLIRKQSFIDSYTQGENSAYNILALKINRQRTPFSYYNIFGNTLQKVGTSINCENVITYGDYKNLNFLTFYLKDSNIIGAIGSGIENNRRILLLREAMNLNYSLPFSSFKDNFNVAFVDLFNLVSSKDKASCFRSMAFDNRYDVDFERLIWLEPEGRVIPNEESFTNSRLASAKVTGDK